MSNQKLIPLKEAAAIAERSASTVKRWIKDGRLKDHRAPGDKRSPILVDRSQLLAACRTQTPRAVNSEQPWTAAPDPSMNSALVDQYEARIKDFQDHNSYLRQRVETLERDNLDLRNANSALDREIRTAGRGYISGLLSMLPGRKG